jgi:hypothetical protein
MPLSNTRELKEDVLFRAGESLTGSAWNTKVIDYLNRVHRTLASGANEFLPEFVDDWWWMKATGTLMLEPVWNTGTVSVELGSDDIIFSSPPSMDMTGRRIKFIGHPELFIIQSHTPDSPNAVLDYPYTGDTNTGMSFEAMRTEYQLVDAAQVLSSPMVSFRHPYRINGITTEKMDELFPLINLEPGVPQAFCLEDETLVRFSHGGNQDGRTMRVEYRYRPNVADLTDSALSIPLVPPQWMHLLSDMALVYVLLDKNDDRSNAAALGARTGLAGMLKENRRRLVKIDHQAGQITPRGGSFSGTASGPRMGRI